MSGDEKPPAPPETPAQPETPECKGNCGKKSRGAQNKINRGMTCAQILQEIQNLSDTDKSGRSGAKGLLQRFRDYQGDDATHSMNIEQQQASLRTYNDAYRDQGCGDPPASAVELADRPLPAPAPSSSGSDTAKTVAIVGGSAVGAYLIYRGIRMIPSIVIPPLWPTIPVNAAVP